MRVINIIHETDFENLKEAVYQGYKEAKRYWLMRLFSILPCVILSVAVGSILFFKLEDVSGGILPGALVLIFSLFLTQSFFSWVGDREPRLDDDRVVYFENCYCRGNSAKELDAIADLRADIWFQKFLKCEAASGVICHVSLWEIVLSNTKCYIVWGHHEDDDEDDTITVTTGDRTYMDEIDLVTFDADEYKGNGSDLVLALGFGRLTLTKIAMNLEPLNVLHEEPKVV